MEQQFAHYGKLLLSHLPRLDALLALALLLCLSGLPVLVAFGQGLAHSSGRSAYDKCARQLGHLGCLLGLVAILAGGVALGLQYRVMPAPDMKNLAALENFLPLLMVGGWLCVAISVLLNSAHAGLLQSRRALPRRRPLLGLLAVLASAAAVYAALLYLYLRAAAPIAPGPPDLRDLLIPVAGAPFWAAISCAPFAALALAGGFGALWLMLRRIADDYGRDHYNLVIPWCAGWARNSWLLLWLLVAARASLRVFQLHQTTGGALDWTRFAPDCAVLVALLLPGLLWLGVSRSTAPLRAKPAAILAPLWAAGCLSLLDLGLR
ncbi:MAG: hypothetical protein LBH94_02400 [Deltaproteobacteria bacterium]|jgi:hypothetical protein|nr:hypothetical protein [Deltaproteobacteria bacterium]